MNKLSLLILILLLANNCSANKTKTFFSKEKSNIDEVQNVKIILTKQTSEEREFNPTLKVKVSDGKLSKNLDKNQNNSGELFYDGSLEKIGKYKFSKFNNFEYIDTQPVFYKEHIIFSDNKGTIILYNQNQKIIWKKNYYSKNEKKLKPRLNFATYKNILIVADNLAKYYAVNIDTGDIIWSKNNTVPFNSEIKIKNNSFYVVDYKNTLKSISINDGKAIWSFKTEESLTKSNTKISIAIKNENIYFINSIGDITSVNLESGKLVWQLPTQNSNISKNAFQLSNSKLVINEDSILLSNNKNEFYSIDIITGLINWKNEINSDLQPVAIGEFIITVSKKGYLYVIGNKTGNIIRINSLYKDYKIKKRKDLLATGFIVAKNKIYLSNNDGRLIIADLVNGNIINTIKIAGTKILQPYVHNNNLFLIRNGSIIKFN